MRDVCARVESRITSARLARVKLQCSIAVRCDRADDISGTQHVELSRLRCPVRDRHDSLALRRRVSDCTCPLGQRTSIAIGARRCAKAEMQPQIVVRVVARLAEHGPRLRVARRP